MTKILNLSFLATFLFLNISFSHAQAGSFRIMSIKEIKTLIGPYPAKGSAEEAADFAELFRWQETRTEEECKYAASQEKATFEIMFKGLLSSDQISRIRPFILANYAESGINMAVAKTIYKRPRPFRYNPAITPCIDLPSSYAYPSGHTATAQAFGRMLSKIYPDRSAEFMKRADEVAQNRVIGGVHHPSDIVAGKKMGDYLAKRIISSKAFQIGLKNL